MAVSEFSLIERYFSRVGADRPDVVLGVGDDGAVLETLEGHRLVTASRSLGLAADEADARHARALAYRLATSAVMAVAAEGGRPAWLTLVLSLPTADEPWLEAFAAGLDEACNAWGVALVGGDTTRGPHHVTLLAHGQRPAAATATPRAGDLVFVTGTLGEPGLAVLHRHGEIELPRAARDHVLAALDHPAPHLELALGLANLGCPATVLEDGLAPQLADLLAPHGLGATLYRDTLPVAEPLAPYLDWVGGRDFLLQAGSGLNLCAVVAADLQADLERECAAHGVTCTWVGLVDKQPGIRTDA